MLHVDENILGGVDVILEEKRPGFISQIRNREAMHRWDMKNRIAFHEPVQDDILLEMEEACPGVSEFYENGPNRSALVAARLYPNDLWGGWGRQSRWR